MGELDEQTGRNRTSKRIRIKKKKIVGGISKRNKGRELRTPYRIKKQERPKALTAPKDIQGMQTLEDWLPGRSPIKQDGTNDVEEDLQQVEVELENPRQRPLIMGTQQWQQPQEGKSQGKSNKRTLPDSQARRTEAIISEERGEDQQRLLDAEGDQLSRPKRQKKNRGVHSDEYQENQRNADGRRKSIYCLLRTCRGSGGNHSDLHRKIPG